MEKAKKNGFTFSKNIPLVLREIYPFDFIASVACKSYYIAIFSHDFAKAFWGEEDYSDGKIVIANLKAWQYHLQQMVRETEPLKYLERFIK